LPTNLPQWIVPEDGLYYLSAHFYWNYGSLKNYKLQIILLNNQNTALAEDGYNNDPSFNESLSCRMLSALVPLTKGTKIYFSIWTGDSGIKIGIKQWHVLLRKGITDKVIKSF
jgi:hypothetical protein